MKLNGEVQGLRFWFFVLWKFVHKILKPPVTCVCFNRSTGNTYHRVGLTESYLSKPKHWVSLSWSGSSFGSKFWTSRIATSNPWAHRPLFIPSPWRQLHFWMLLLSLQTVEEVANAITEVAAMEEQQTPPYVRITTVLEFCSSIVSASHSCDLMIRWRYVGAVVMLHFVCNGTS